MSQKKNKQARANAQQVSQPKKSAAPQNNKAPEPEPKRSKAGLIMAAVAVLVVAGIAIASLSSNNGGQNQSGAAPQASAEEAAYIGRLLPTGYSAPSVAQPTRYTSTIEMSELSLAESDSGLTVPLTDVLNTKLALMQYQLPSGEQLPLIAYVKPSGALFVGVSFCPPCQGEWQTIQADGTLTCNACGTKRDLESMVGISGTCKLYPLDEIPVTIVDDTIVIDRAVLDGWTPQPLDREVG